MAIFTHVDRPLTNLSVAYMGEIRGLLSSVIFPIVNVTKRSDIYFVYNKGDFNRAGAVLRAPGALPNYGDYRVTSSTPYYAKEYDQATLLPMEDQANQDSPLEPEQDAIEFCMRSVLLKKELVWKEAMWTTGVWEHDYDGVGGDFATWDDPTSVPVDDVIGWRRTMLKDTLNAISPDSIGLAIGAGVYDTLRRHPDVKKALGTGNTSYSGDIGVEQLRRYFGVSRVEVGEVAHVTSNPGAASDTETLMYDKEVLLFGTNMRPTLRSVMAGVSIAWDFGLGVGSKGVITRQFQEDNRMAKTIQCIGAWDHKVISPECGIFARRVIN